MSDHVFRARISTNSIPELVILLEGFCVGGQPVLDLGWLRSSHVVALLIAIGILWGSLDNLFVWADPLLAISSGWLLVSVLLALANYDRGVALGALRSFPVVYFGGFHVMAGLVARITLEVAHIHTH
jgi:hypothetical protein